MKLRSYTSHSIAPSFFLILFFTLLLPLTSQAQSKANLAKELLQSKVDAAEIASADMEGMIISSETYSTKSGVTHVYFQQTVHDIPIYNAILNVHLTRENTLLSYGNRFIPEARGRNNVPVPVLTQEAAIEAAAAHLGYTYKGDLIIKERKTGPTQEVIFENNQLSQADIPVRLTWQPMEDGSLRLAWELNIGELSGENWWNIRIDAATGELLDQNNWVVHCSFGDMTGEVCEHHPGTPHTLHETVATATENMLTGGTYNVFPQPLKNPDDGSRSLVSDPADLTASPYGWHDTNGAPGAEYTITQGNNVHAQLDDDANNGTGFSPDGGAGLVFDFPLDLATTPDNYRPAAITNLFYWNNYMHDFSYLYGFDEVAGNFQSNNYGKGGTGNDYVFADAQDGNGVNNANFFTPAEGANPRMQMYIFTNANPDRDSDLDNGVIAHEYGHGISNRLTGGPANVGCLSNSEQMGEGWSDFFGLMTTMKPGDKAGDRRGIGNYALNQAPGANGFRPAPYTTDMSVNSSTYGTLPGSAIPHGVGYVWCTMLWEMTWNLIHAHGMETGYEEAMNLVMEGMKLQPCSPGFIDGRNAILAADVALYGGVNACLIWEAFARRGLGVSATQGSTNSINDGVQAFNTPNTCFTSSPGYRGFCLYPGNDGPVRYKVYAGTGFNGALTLSVSGLPSGASGLFFYSPLEPGDSAEYYMNPPYGAAPGTYLLTFTGFDGDIYYTTKAVLEVKASNQVATLTSPANMSTTQDLTPTLTWEQYPEALGYYLQVSTASNFSSYVVNTTPTNNSYTIPTALADNTTYYWRVFPNLGCIPNGTQTVRSFTTACSAGIIPPVLVAPADGATEVPLVTVLDWEDTPEAVTYGISVATDMDFTNIVVNASGLTTSTYPTILSGNTTYYWRSTATYTCGTSSPSTPFSFTTENVNVTCTTFASTDVPVTISASGTPTITSTLNIPVNSTVLDVNVLNLDITHTYIHDLKVKLTSPVGTIRTLLDSPCSGQDNILINFDDESTNNYGSYPCPPTNNGTYKPNQSLAVFDGQTTMGNWTLTVQDIASEDGGSLNAWSVNVCYTEAIPDITCYQDSDGDTYGNLAQPSGFSGSCGTGYVLDGTDCDDAVGAVNPGATETCNGVDDNCDTFTDEGLLLTFYDDSDGDGYGNPASSTLACVVPNGFVNDNTDCDDTPGSGTAINPAAQEVCNSGIDDDCDGLADDNDPSITGQPDWYQDFDGDGLGNPDIFLLACLQPVGYVPDSLDCNDNSTVTTCTTPSGLTTSAVTDVSATLNWTSSPGAQRYNLEFKPASASSYGPSIKVYTNSHVMTGLLPGTKYNWRVRAVCDSLCSISSGLMAGPAVKTKYRVYTDADGDGFGDGAQLNYELISTFPAAGYSSNNLDCNDANSAIKPSATELCNGIDDDCDLLVDEGTTATTWYEDSDGDGLGNAAVSQLTCIPPSGYVSNAFDCNDQIVEAICLLPSGVSAEMISQYSASLVWQTSPCVSFYSIKYKKSTDPTWTNVPAYYGDNYPLSGLTPGSLYYYQVRSRCTATSPTTTSAWVSGSFSTLVLPMGLAAEDGGQGNHLLPEGNELEIYPNPGDGIFNLSMNSDLAVPATIKVTDVLGKLLLASTWPLDKGMNTYQLDLSLLAAGVYHLEIQRGEMKQAKKIVIVR